MFEDIVYSDTGRTARGWCPTCKADRILRVSEYTGAVGLSCTRCDHRATLTDTPDNGPDNGSENAV